MTHRAAALALASALAASAALADPGLAARHMPAPERVGEGRLSFMLWDVYDATLYAPGGEYRADGPLALGIRYLREIEGEDIAERTVEEMRGQGIDDEAALGRWLGEMVRIFPDVTPGTVLTGVRAEDGSTVFYRGDAEIGRIADPAFGRAFFDIWLGERTSEPKLRRALLGRSG